MGQQVNEWQPIETAPLDGTVVDVWNDGERVIDAWFHDGRWLTSDVEWTSELEPTYWMPIPPPPSGEVDNKDRERLRVIGNLGALWQC
jgi:hypothetical protein